MNFSRDPYYEPTIVVHDKLRKRDGMPTFKTKALCLVINVQLVKHLLL